MGVHFDTQFRNPLAYPAGYAPGFDPSHVGAKKGLVHFSGIGSSGGFVNILRGQVGVVVNAPTYSVKGPTGPSMGYLSTTDTHTFAGNYAVKANAHTVAAILHMSSISGGTACVFSSSGGNAGVQLFYQATTGLLQLSSVSGSGGTLSAVGVTANTSHFIIASSSGDGGTANYLVMNLATGVIKTDVQTATTQANTPDGVYAIGNTTSSARPVSGSVAAVAFTNSFLSISEMRQWASDPWSFWYPNPGDNWIAAQAAGFPYWGVQNNNFVIGTGVQ